MERLDVDGYKIHSSDMANRPLLQLVASLSKPTLLAASDSTHIELSDAIDTLKKHGIKDIILMHGFQGFPTGIEDSELNRIRLLGEHYGLPVGYADHSDGSSPPGYDSASGGNRFGSGSDGEAYSAGQRIER